VRESELRRIFKIDRVYTALRAPASSPIITRTLPWTQPDAGLRIQLSKCRPVNVVFVTAELVNSVSAFGRCLYQPRVNPF